MKELTSNFDDVEKRLAIFFGLGALVLCSLYNLVAREPLEVFLVRGVAVGTAAILGGWAYGSFLRKAVAAAQPEEELPANVEVRAQNAQELGAGGSVPLPTVGETVIEDGASGRVVDFTMPELAPPSEPAMIPSAVVASQAAQSAAAPMAVADEGDLPPPPVPAGLR